VALGLLTDLYPMADEIQHGNLAQIGGLFSTFVSATPSNLRINLDGHDHLETTALMMMVTNMPFLGPHFQISPDVSFKDGRLDVFTFSDMGKLNMISYAMLSRGGLLEDAGIKHYRAKEVSIISTPQMPVLADGTLLSQGCLSIHIHAHALSVMTGAELAGLPAAASAAVVTDLERVPGE
jgi:diacylglycerol kinase family enzyme